MRKAITIEECRGKKREPRKHSGKQYITQHISHQFAFTKPGQLIKLNVQIDGLL